MSSASLTLKAYASPAELARAAADAWTTELLERPTPGSYAVAVSGGRIAGTFFQAVAEIVGSLELDFQDVHFFWADERCVPPDHPESNFLLAHTNLLEPLHVPRRFIHRIKGELDPEQSASLAEQEMYDVLGQPTTAPPVLDLVILGMGEDGHVASLFPGEPPDVADSPAVYRAVTAIKPPPLRITLGYSAIEAAREVWVLASGAGKEGALRQSLMPGGSTPLGRVLARARKAMILTDVPNAESMFKAK